MYASASARFAENSDDDTVAVGEGVDWMIVGTSEIVTEGAVDESLLDDGCVDVVEVVLIELAVEEEF